MSDYQELLIITEEEAEQRLDAILAKRFSPAFSRTYFQHLIDHSLVTINGQPVKKRIKPKEGDEIDIQFTAAPEIQLLPENIPLSIIYEDEHILVINKPAGMVVHPALGNWTGTLVNALLYHCGYIPSSDDQTLRPGIVHRLDKDTSGVIVAAKTLSCQQKLTALFASREVHKEYLGICVGKPKEGELKTFIGRHPVRRKEMAVTTKGREAISTFQVISWNETVSFIKAIISTGRTHQIRVHLKHLAAPILGDQIYGSSSANKTYAANKQFLHASLLRFVHPETGKEMEFIAPLRPEMELFCKNQLAMSTLRPAVS